MFDASETLFLAALQLTESFFPRAALQGLFCCIFWPSTRSHQESSTRPPFCEGERFRFRTKKKRKLASVAKLLRSRLGMFASLPLSHWFSQYTVMSVSSPWSALLKLLHSQIFHLIPHTLLPLSMLLHLSNLMTCYLTSKWSVFACHTACSALGMIGHERSF